MRPILVRTLIAVGLMLLTVSCQHTSPDAADEAAVAAAQAAARRQLDTVVQLVNSGDLNQAEAILETTSPDYYGDERAQLAERVQQRRQLERKALPAKVSEHAVLQQVQDRLRLPDTHGRTVTITRVEEPLELPPGPMEKLVNRKVSMNLEKAPVKDIIMALSKIDGLNIIADQSLTGDDEGGPTLTVQVKDVPLKEILSYIARNMDITFSLSENVVWVSQADGEAAGAKGAQLETRIFSLRRGLLPGSMGGGTGGASAEPGDALAAAVTGAAGSDDDELMRALDAFLADAPTGTLFKLFPTRNLLVVRSTHEKMRLVEQLVREFDIAPQQVLIEARFLTISQKALKDLGGNLQQLAYTNPTASLKSFPARDANGAPVLDGNGNPTFRQVYDAGVQSGIFASTMSAPLGTPASTNQLALSGVLGNLEYSYILRALEEQASTKTLSAPRVTVANNRAASIHKGENMYYWEEWESDVSQTPSNNNNTTATQTALPRPSGAPTEVKLGLQLDVKVNIGNDGQTVMLALNPAITALKSFYTYGTGQDPTAAPQNNNNNNNINGTNVTGYQLPVIADNSISTSAVVKSGETVVLGGVLEDLDQEKVEQTPFLHSIPIIGWFFKHKSSDKEPQHLLIFVTATVVSPTGEFVETQTVPGAVPAPQK